jgi:predicted nucleic acid-binding protein
MEIIIGTSALLAVVGEQPEKATLIRLTRGAALVAPASVHWEVGNALSAMFKRKAIGLDAALELLDAYVIACALNQRAPILTLDRGLIERARDLKPDVLEVNVSSRPILILRRGKTFPRCSRKRNAMG